MIPELTETTDNMTESEMNCLNGNFLCGVVEGFYGRPWTTEQRRKLFKRLNKLGMNMYLYAPKDDSKHRVYWRDLYSVEEADHLTGLIESAEKNNVNFVYALSPGLDITFSSAKDVTNLKRKMEQVASFGCRSFALLFDDIETEMNEADKEIFRSFAHAQVSVTNEVYQHLGQPTFLFCPTEYCATRAIPNVSQSEYLQTVGSKLLRSIDIMWTGPQVVSRKISIQSIQEVTKVLQRPPVIWDNIHANDYDMRRLFLGPYDGRSPELIPYLRGVLTNPNCEFEANFVAIHTLSQWSKSNVGGAKKDIVLSESPVNADIRLETESEYSSEEDLPNRMDNRYQPRQALDRAIAEWIEEFINEERAEPLRKKVTLSKSAESALVPSVNTCMSVTATTCTPSQTGNISGPIPIIAAGIKNANLAETNDSYMQPSMSAVPVNSLVDPVVSDSEESTMESAEPMDCVPTPGTSPATSSLLPPSSNLDSSSANTETAEDSTDCKTHTEVMQVDCDTCTSTSQVQVDSSPSSLLNEKSQIGLTKSDMMLLVDLFYLPFEHGGQAVDMLTEFHWLKINAHKIMEAKSKSCTVEQKDEAEVWHHRAKLFRKKIGAVFQLMENLVTTLHHTELLDIFPYLWDLNATLDVIDVFVQWLACGHVPYISVCYMQGSQFTWSNKTYKDTFVSGDQEPWIFRGGLTGEFQRLLPIETAGDLFLPLIPVVPCAKMHRMRPYKSSDEAAVYEVCRRTCDDGMDGTDIFPGQPDLIGDKLVGAFLTNSPEYCFVVQDHLGTMCGYGLAALDGKMFAKHTEMGWIPHLQEKYPKPEQTDGLSPAEELILGFHNYTSFLPESLYRRFPSVIKLDILSSTVEGPVPRRLMVSVLTALKANGSHGVHTQLHVGDRAMLEFYTKLGFFDVSLVEQAPEDVLLLGRVL